MRVALSADMEGVSQLDDWRAVLAFERTYWFEGRAQMEADVAAAARGLLTGGADEVVVLDNHASGNPVNVRPESLPTGARLETWNLFDLGEQGVDALLQVGYPLACGTRRLLPAHLLAGVGAPRGRRADQRKPRSRVGGRRPLARDLR
jgi:D-aminopeptidase